MSADRELLELAAKAAGIEILRSRLENPICADMLLVERTDDGRAIGWNPLNDDGDAHRLTVLLGIEVIKSRHSRSIGRVVQAWYPPDGNHRRSATAHITVAINGDRYVATRRAIVTAAAEIGKAMP